MSLQDNKFAKYLQDDPDFQDAIKGRVHQGMGNDNDTTNTNTTTSPITDLFSIPDLPAPHHQPPPPPEPNRNNNQEYDTNHWSRLLNNARHMLGKRTYDQLLFLYKQRLRLVERKDRSLVFMPPKNEIGWDIDEQGNPLPDARERTRKAMKVAMTLFYMRILNDVATGTAQGDDLPLDEEKWPPAYQAIKKAIKAGAAIVPNTSSGSSNGSSGKPVSGPPFRFDWNFHDDLWDRDTTEKRKTAIVEARSALDEVGSEVVGWLYQVGDVVKRLGFVMKLTEMAEVVGTGPGLEPGPEEAAGIWEWGDL